MAAAQGTVRLALPCLTERFTPRRQHRLVLQQAAARRRAVLPEPRGLGANSPPLVAGAFVARCWRRKCRRRQGVAVAPDNVRAEDRWLLGLDLEGFGREMAELGQRLRAEQGEADLQHLKGVVSWSNACAVLGLATMWLQPNPLTVLALSLWTHSRWTMVAHHSLHGGYNRLDSSGRYASRNFGIGTLQRRVLDWFDWMLPEAWSVYHNQGHHYRVNEPADPDYFEKYTDTWKLNRDFMTVLSMLFFKWAFAAPNTYKALKLAELRRAGKPLPEGFDPQLTMTIFQVFRLDCLGKGLFSAWEFLSRVIGPYLLMHFFVLPLPLALVDPAFYWHGVANLFLGELVANVHGFIVTTFNHTGDDVYSFERGCRPNSPTFYLRAVIGSANCTAGGDVNDFMHGYLNYQIEHHLWPDLSMLSYRRGQPQAKAICEKYGVPYVQGNIFSRLRKVLGIFTGRARMRRFPEHLEREVDLMDWDNRGSTHAQVHSSALPVPPKKGDCLITS